MSSAVVLLVEDDAWLAEIEMAALTAAGYTVVYAPHATSAMVKLDERIPDVMVLDVLLTGTTIMPFLHEIQTYGDSRRIPIILCTNLAEQLRLEDFQPYGVLRILDKSVMKPEDLVAAIKVAL